MKLHWSLLTVALAVAGCGRTTPEDARRAADRDLMDVTVPRLQELYFDRRYTVTQVVQWHLDRIDRYTGIYGAIVYKSYFHVSSKNARSNGHSAASYLLDKMLI